MTTFKKTTGIAGILCCAAFVRADVPNKFAAGDALSAAKLNANFDTVVDKTSDQAIAGKKTFAAAVGIGATNPTAKLHVLGDGGTVVRLESPAPGARQWDLDIKSGTLVFGDNTVHQDRLAIDAMGRVGIGTDFPATTMQVVGDIRIGSGATGCVQNAAGGALVGTCSSDARFKRGIEPIEGALAKVERLRPVTYEWRREEFPDRRFGAGRTPGLIAQEVERVAPELVATNADGYKAVSYGVPLEMLALEAIKELSAKNAALEARIARLEAQLRTR